jgi:hypothetical protein
VTSLAVVYGLFVMLLAASLMQVLEIWVYNPHLMWVVALVYKLDIMLDLSSSHSAFLVLDGF